MNVGISNPYFLTHTQVSRHAQPLVPLAFTNGDSSTTTANNNNTKNSPSHPEGEFWINKRHSVSNAKEPRTRKLGSLFYSTALSAAWSFPQIWRALTVLWFCAPCHAQVFRSHSCKVKSWESTCIMIASVQKIWLPPEISAEKSWNIDRKIPILRGFTTASPPSWVSGL